jgi:hypothetical protein
MAAGIAAPHRLYEEERWNFAFIPRLFSFCARGRHAYLESAVLYGAGTLRATVGFVRAARDLACGRSFVVSMDLRLSGLLWADRLGVLRSGVLGEFLATRPCGVDYEE